MLETELEQTCFTRPAPIMLHVHENCLPTTLTGMRMLVHLDHYGQSCYDPQIPHIVLIIQNAVHKMIYIIH